MTKLEKGWTVSRNLGIAKGNLDMIIQELTWRCEEGDSQLWKDRDLLKMAKKALTCLDNKEKENEF